MNSPEDDSIINNHKAALARIRAANSGNTAANGSGINLGGILDY